MEDVIAKIKNFSIIKDPFDLNYRVLKESNGIKSLIDLNKFLKEVPLSSNFYQGLQDLLPLFAFHGDKDLSQIRFEDIVFKSINKLQNLYRIEATANYINYSTKSDVRVDFTLYFDSDGFVGYALNHVFQNSLILSNKSLSNNNIYDFSYLFLFQDYHSSVPIRLKASYRMIPIGENAFFAVFNAPFNEVFQKGSILVYRFCDYSETDMPYDNGFLLNLIKDDFSFVGFVKLDDNKNYKFVSIEKVFEEILPAVPIDQVDSFRSLIESFSRGRLGEGSIQYFAILHGNSILFLGKGIRSLFFIEIEFKNSKMLVKDYAFVFLHNVLSPSFIPSLDIVDAHKNGFLKSFSKNGELSYKRFRFLFSVDWNAENIRSKTISEDFYNEVLKEFFEQGLPKEHVVSITSFVDNIRHCSSENFSSFLEAFSNVHKDFTRPMPYGFIYDALYNAAFLLDYANWKDGYIVGINLSYTNSEFGNACVVKQGANVNPRLSLPILTAKFYEINKDFHVNMFGKERFEVPGVVFLKDAYGHIHAFRQFIEFDGTSNKVFLGFQEADRVFNSYLDVLESGVVNKDNQVQLRCNFSKDFTYYVINDVISVSSLDVSMFFKDFLYFWYSRYYSLQHSDLSFER